METKQTSVWPQKSLGPPKPSNATVEAMPPQGLGRMRTPICTPQPGPTPRQAPRWQAIPFLGGFICF